MSTTIQISLPFEEQEGKEIEVTAALEYTPACRGSREPGTGLLLEPDTDEEMDFLWVETPENFRELTPAEKELFILAGFFKIAQDRADAIDAKADRDYQDQKENRS